MNATRANEAPPHEITGVGSASARVAAMTAGVPDVFVLRRVSAGRFVHLGGAGRGEGWAGIVEVTLEDEADLEHALATASIVRVERDQRELVFGPYYASFAAIVPIGADVIVIFGSPDGAVPTPDEQLLRAAQTAIDAIGPVGRAKELADRLELLEAMQKVNAIDTRPVAEAMRALALTAAEVLACELGIVYLEDGDRIEVIERGFPLSAPIDGVRKALAVVAQGEDFPFCVQDARRSPPPGPLADVEGIRSYYLLELTGTANGVLFVAHTDAAPRGFTLLCRRLGIRVAEAGSALLGRGLTQEWIENEAALLDRGFAELEG